MLADVTKTTEVALPMPCGCWTKKDRLARDQRTD